MCVNKIALLKAIVGPLLIRGPRAKRVKQREVKRLSTVDECSSSGSSSTSLPSCVCSSTPIPSPVVHTTTRAEQLGNCQVYNLPSPHQMSPTPLAHIEMLETENASLKVSLAERRYPARWQTWKFPHRLYIFAVFKPFFFNFLGPAVDCLNYWGDKKGEWLRKHPRKIDPINQLFLNLKLKDLVHRFSISEGLASCYITTWICFLTIISRGWSGCHLLIKYGGHYQLLFKEISNHLCHHWY